MVRKTQLVILIFSMIGFSLLSSSARANPATLKCNSNHDQIWVYDSLNSFNVDARLKCGQGVEIIERLPNYVKIRAQNGVEGYVPDTAVAGLPVFQPYRDSAHDVGLAAKQVQAVEVAKATAQAASLAPPNVNYSNISPTSASVASSAAPAAAGKKTPASVSMASSPALGALKPVSAISDAKPAASTAPAAALPATKPAAESPGIVAVQPARAPSPSTINSGSAADSVPPLEQSNTSCQTYFSAYGLTPSQTKWIAMNREKAFSQICPAPDPSKVDFVMIFTHDVDFFSGTMPDAVHKSGDFSDFRPMTPMDSALIPQSQADSARREYVWIFQFEQGTFDPASFSAKRRYQFSKMETGSLGSKAGVKTIEDAFRFIARASH